MRTEAQNPIPTSTFLKGIHALDEINALNILFIPETTQLDPRAASTVNRAAIGVAEQHRAMYILDPPITKGHLSSPATLLSWMSRQKVIHHPSVVVYAPAIRVQDSAKSSRPFLIPTSGTMAGLWTRTDYSRGVWKAPAGVEATLRKIHSLQFQMTEQDLGSLNTKGVNPLHVLPSKQIVSWGARTLSNNSEWRYVPVRRLALMIESSPLRGTQWVVFEPNDEPLWANIRQSVGHFLNGLFREGAFQGARPEEAYFVRCGPDTMSANDQRIGTVNIMVGFAPLKPAEFVILTIQQQAQALRSS